MTALISRVKGIGLILLAAGICWRGATFNYTHGSGVPVIVVCLLAGLSLLSLGVTVAGGTSSEADRGL